MRFFAILPLALATLSSALATPPTKREASEPVIAAIENELDSISVSLNDDIDSLVDKLGLGAVDSTVDDLLKDLVGDVDSLVDEVDSLTDGLLEDLGLGIVVTTIDELESALGLSSTDTVGTLLEELGILPSS